MELYKVTNADGTSCYGGKGRWTLNRWRSARGPLVPYVRGLHLCRRGDLVEWFGPAIWRAEYDGELIEADDKVVARKARVVERIEAWDERTARLFAADCAERILYLFEAKYPNDDRPRRAIEAARAYANGEITDDALWDAAEAAARDAASDAAGAAAWAAAGAARAAAWDAAWAAAWAAARAAARDAARAAARDTWEAAWEAAWAAERAWQTERLFDYLEGRAG